MTPMPAFAGNPIFTDSVPVSIPVLGFLLTIDALVPNGVARQLSFSSSSMLSEPYDLPFNMRSLPIMRLQDIVHKDSLHNILSLTVDCRAKGQHQYGCKRLGRPRHLDSALRRKDYLILQGGM